MKPSIGRIVIFRQGDHDASAHPGGSHGVFPGGEHHRGSNGTREHPAIITRVWSDICVNLTVFFDAYPPESRTSIMMLPELPEGVANTSGNSGWKWPPRA